MCDNAPVSEEIPKDIAKELFRKCFLSGVRIKNLSTIRNHHGAAELVMQARTVGRGMCFGKKDSANHIRSIRAWLLSSGFRQDNYS